MGQLTSTSTPSAFNRILMRTVPGHSFLRPKYCEMIIIPAVSASAITAGGEAAAFRTKCRSTIHSET